jgi:hygromycin-B 7''-O-kinase
VDVSFPWLPPVDWDTYWREWHPAPVATWRPALETIRARHSLPSGRWARFPRGRNAVFALGDRFVLKLVPPFWAADAAREVAALAAVGGQLPVATPTLLADGRLDGWSYLVQRRLPGEVLADVWKDLEQAERAAIARQQGQVMRALHDLPTPNATALRYDWAGMLIEQALAVHGELSRGGLAGRLLDDLRAYLAARRVSWVAPVALLHGDLDVINLLVERAGDRWRVTGLVDWSDAKVGPVAHEFISPGVHTFQGDRAALRAWYVGYGLDGDREAFQRQVMARALLYYPDTLPKLLQRMAGAADAVSWDEVARAFWQMEDNEPA